MSFQTKAVQGLREAKDRIGYSTLCTLLKDYGVPIAKTTLYSIVGGEQLPGKSKSYKIVQALKKINKELCDSSNND